MTLKINLAVEHNLALLTLRLLFFRLDVANMLTRTEVLEVLDSAGAGDLADFAVERRGTGVLVHTRPLRGLSLANAVVGSPIDDDGRAKRQDFWTFASLRAGKRRRNRLGRWNLNPRHRR